ncbi:unnamed protein product [Mycena citricolor]|uniref:Integral membrane protein n=1 Tax=Mycena citricolor TaxID=2018698 RepID=A0AAD2K0W4_9AGAR|nr:unnamed protein product [Mycena citricolor]CAK5272802.1 unnamed protein product [Mycena citricolor]
MSSHSSVPQVDRDLEAQERAQEPSAEYHGRWHVALHPSVKKNTPRGALPFLHPTHATLTSSTGDKLRWTSRDHRKNRHVVSNPRSGQPRQAKDDGMWTKFARMRRVEYWNISWWVAMAFTSGSIVWVINGFIVFLPFVNSHVGKDMVGGGWSAWIGATIFEFGGILAMWEAWNRGDSSDFGWGVDQMLQTADLKRPGSLRSDHGEPPMPEKKRWIWFSLEGKYFHEIGFLAAFVQYWAATIFWISGFTGLPAIQDAITSNTGLLDGVYWTPQVIGGTGFIISSCVSHLLPKSLTKRRSSKNATDDRSTKEMVPSGPEFAGVADRLLEPGWWGGIHFMRSAWLRTEQQHQTGIPELMFHVLGWMGLLDRESDTV